MFRQRLMLSGSASSLCRKSKVILRFLCLFLFMLHCSLSYAEEIDGKALLKKGKEELDCKKYEDAIKSLSEAEKEFPLLGDYALLWLSEAYHETGNHAESLRTTRTFLKKYPESPLKKKVRIKEIEEAEEVSEENLQQMFEFFIKEYPNDTEIKYAYAQWLKKTEKMDIAKSLFKDIYISANSFSGLAYNELCPDDIRVEDLIKRASNLMELRDLRGAESALRSALEKDNGTLQNEILKSLGLCLFKQKRYLEAAGIYEKVNEKFWRALSLYRAGDKEVLNSALEELIQTGDKRAGSILNAVASDKRRDGEIKDALKIHQEVLEKYPSETEDALWGIGWIYFLTGEYGKAADVFTKLYEDYEDTRYLYWKARSLEVSGKDASDFYLKLKKKDRDFYSVLSYLRTERPSEQSNTKKINMSSNDPESNKNNPPSPPFTKGGKGGLPGETQKFLETANQDGGNTIASNKFDRVEALFEIGLSKEALSELINVSKIITSTEDILYLGSRFQDIGEYKYIVRLTERLPYKENLHHLFYPLAYWDSVKTICQKYDIDPLLIFSVMREESMFNPNANSIAGAVGLMQIGRAFV